MLLTITNLAEKTTEIKDWQRIENGAAFEIGRILLEVKAMEIPQGEWTEWLISVDYNPRTAQRYMQVYERFHAIPAAADVPFSKLTEMLQLPVDVDASDFIAENGSESVRAIRDKVREVKGGPISDRKRKPKKSSRVDEITVALNNLNEFHSKELEEGNLTIDILTEIGKNPHDVQKKLQSFYPINCEFKVGVIVILIKGKLSFDEISNLVSKYSVTRVYAFSYRENPSVAALLKRCEETVTYDISCEDFIEIMDELSEVVDRIQAEEIESKQKEWADMFSDFTSGEDRSKSEHQNRSYGSQKASVVQTILGLELSAEGAEIKRQFRRLVKVLHPDQGGSSYLYDQVVQAYREYERGA